MRMRFAIAISLVFFCAGIVSAEAQVTVGAACSTTNLITIQPNQIDYCNASSVWAIGEEITSAGLHGIDTTAPLSTLSINGGAAIGTTYATTNAPGSNNLIVQGTAGIGTATPATTLQVNGEILPGSTGLTCASGVQGAIRYNSTSNVLQFCDGSNWGSLPATSCSSSTPAAFVFTNQTGVSVSTLTTSNIVQITGITCNVTTQVSGSGSPQYQICSDNACGTVLTSWTSSNATLSNGQYVQMRLTSSSGGSTATTATLSVGSNSTSWSVTTAAYCTGSSPTVGTICSDGTKYAGLDTGSVQMFVTPCDYGQTYSSGSCSGYAPPTTWNNGTGSGTTTGETSTATGYANTTYLAADTDSDSPYNAARVCHNLSFGGHTDWFLPAQTQLGYLGNSYSTLGMTNTTGYWSSTELSTTNAYGYNFAYSRTVGPAKTTGGIIRCMRETSGASGCGVTGTISTQSQQTLTVPAGCSVTFKVWGAGGGGGGNNTFGGGGGYSTITVSTGVSAVTYYLATGGGGAANTVGGGGAGVSGYTGGAAAGNAGGGGAASAVWTGGYGSSGTPLVVAAGGGGGPGFGGASNIAGGTGGAQNSSTAGGAPSSSGGGGGAGYSTGGAGGTGGSNGVGGSDYSASGGSTSAGNNATPGNSGDSNRPTNAGAGGANSSTAGYTGAIYYSY